MALFLTLLPLYIAGNIHCLGMCGPLVMLLGAHPYRLYYFLGRTTSFTIVATLSGLLGASLTYFFGELHIPVATTFVFSFMILAIGFFSLVNFELIGQQQVGKMFSGVGRRISLLMTQKGRLPVFLFGLLTVVLPCGQTLVVFSACALAQDPWIGFFNGLAFALLTSPSLWLAMRFKGLFSKAKGSYKALFGGLTFGVASLGFARGAAEIGWLEHLSWVTPWFHLVLY
jgi:sulfite exporter TauE/SafE